MAADPDDEALSWSGETDPTHVAAPASEKVAASGDIDDIAEAANPVFLVVLGLLVGVYVLYAVGWGIHAFTTPARAAGAFPVIMYQLGEFFSIASPFLWAVAVWLLAKKTSWRLLWLFVGVLVLAPWPFILGG